jgi:predicted dehydrogenase
MKTWNFVDQNEYDDDVMVKYSVNPPNVYGFGHNEFYKHAVNAISDGGKNLIDGIAGRKSLEIITAIYESIESGQPVHLRFSPRRSCLGRAPLGTSD